MFRKSTKKARQDSGSKSKRYEDDHDEDGKPKPQKSETSGAAKRAAAKAKALEEAKKQKPVKLPKNYTDVRAKAKAPKRKPAPSKAPEEVGKGKEPRQSKAKVSSEMTEASLTLRPPKATESFRVVVGCYERLLYGLSVDASDFSISANFIFPAHVSSIKSVSCAGDDSKWLATGGTDEAIKVWDLRKRIEVGTLTGHEGTITSLHFPTRTYLLTTGEDGRINIFRTRDWALLKTLKGHIGSVNDVAAHPSGRLALSVGKDKTIRMWDLMRGVGAASTKIGEEGEKVRWDTKGQRFAVLAGPHLRVHDTEMKVLGEVKAKVRWHDVCFYDLSASEQVMFVAGEDKMVHIYDVTKTTLVEELPTFTEVARLTGHGNRCVACDVFDTTRAEVRFLCRVKSVAVQPVQRVDSASLAAVTISSDGHVRLFDLAPLLARKDGVIEIESTASYNTKGSRLTCLSVVGVLGSSRKSVEEEEIESDPEDEEDDDDGESEDDEDEGADTEEEERELEDLQRVIDEAKGAGMLEDAESDAEEEAEGEDSEAGEA